MDYRKYYHLEKYLFTEVTKKYRNRRTLTTFDFFCIVIWKANRAKSRVAQSLLKHGYKNLDKAVSALVREIRQARNARAKLEVLFNWEIRLPMASAILTVLYPQTFTVYDVRVCRQLGKYREIKNLTRFDSVWRGYQAYIDAVKIAVPQQRSLRNKDRWLWGRSFEQQLRTDIRNKFRAP